MAKKLDEQTKRQMSAGQTRDCVHEKREFNDEERSVVHYASTKSPDSYGSVCLPDSWKDRRFSKNPVVFFAHQYDVPVGRAMWYKPDQMGLLCKTQFADTAIGNELYAMYKDDFLRGWSMGWNPLNWVWEDAEEFKKLVEKWKLDDFEQGFDLIYTENLMYEWSVAPLPANEDSLTAALQDGKIQSDILVRTFGEQLKLDSRSTPPPRIETTLESKPDEDTIALRKEVSILTSQVLDLTRQVKRLSENRQTNNPPAPKKTERKVLQATDPKIMTMLQKTIQDEIRKATGKLPE